MTDSLEEWIYSNDELLSNLKCTFDNYNQNFASILVYENVHIIIKRTDKWELNIKNHSSSEVFQNKVLCKINNDMKIKEVICLLFEEIHNLPDPESLEWGSSSSGIELSNTNSDNKQQFIEAFKTSDIYKQYEEFKDYLHRNNCLHLVSIDEILPDGLISILIRPAFFDVSDSELMRLGLTINSSIEISLIVTDDAKLYYLANILSNIWIMMKHGLLKYEVKFE